MVPPSRGGATLNSLPSSHGLTTRAGEAGTKRDFGRWADADGPGEAGDEYVWGLATRSRAECVESYAPRPTGNVGALRCRAVPTSPLPSHRTRRRGADVVMGHRHRLGAGERAVAARGCPVDRRVGCRRARGIRHVRSLPGTCLQPPDGRVRARRPQLRHPCAARPRGRISPRLDRQTTSDRARRGAVPGARRCRSQWVPLVDREPAPPRPPPPARRGRRGRCRVRGGLGTPC